MVNIKPNVAAKPCTSFTMTYFASSPRLIILLNLYLVPPPMSPPLKIATR